jgi:hypothetical protein
MSQVPGGWFKDPYGRFEQRYWDGEKWTEFVATGGTSVIDPMGASPVIPFATPGSAFAPPGTIADDAAEDAVRSGRGVRFLDSMGEPARERRRPSLRAAVAGLGGTAIAIGLLIALAGDSPGRGRLIAVSLGLLALAAVLRLFVKVHEVQAAAVGVLLVGIVGFGISATASGNRADFLTGLLLAALFIGAWAAPGFRGTNLLLAIGLLALLGGVGSLTTTSNSLLEKCNQYIADGNFDAYDKDCQALALQDTTTFLPTAITDSLGDQGVIYLAGAALFLGATWVLDRRGYRGTATAFAAAGLLAALVGTGLLTSKFGSTSGPVFVTVVGVLVCIAGSHGGRRATTWWGAVLVALGVIAFVAIEMKPTSSGEAGAVGIVGGLVLVVLPLLGAPVRRAMADRSATDLPPPE